MRLLTIVYEDVCIKKFFILLPMLQKLISLMKPESNKLGYYRSIRGGQVHA